MPCCSPRIQAFSSLSTISIPYNQTYRDAYGNVPNVDVYIRDEESGQYVDTEFIQVHLKGSPLNEVAIDFGGPATGFVKIY